MVDERLKKIDRKIAKLGKNLKLKWINPINVSEEKERFFSSRDYEPQFVYPRYNFSFSEQYDKISSLYFENTLMDQLYKKKVERMTNFLKMLQSRDSKDFTYYSKEVSGEPNKKLIWTANLFLGFDTPKIKAAKASISTEKAIKFFEEVLINLKFNWTVESDDIVANAMVIPSEKKFVIKKNYHFTQKQIKRFVAHEIFGHILRAECGMLQPYNLFCQGLPGYESTEEGIALYKEKVAGTLNAATLKGFAGRVVAIKIALENGFRKTFEFLSKFYSKNQAWDLTIRVKRGLSDTSKPGAFTKDLIYLKGYVEVNDYLSKGKPLKLLHYGKVGVNHIPYLKAIPGLVSPDILLENSSMNLYDFKDKLFW
jgi:uncharacterized protein (TIGR02421 family)